MAEEKPCFSKRGWLAYCFDGSSSFFWAGSIKYGCWLVAAAVNICLQTPRHWWGKHDWMMRRQKNICLSIQPEPLFLRRKLLWCLIRDDPLAGTKVFGETLYMTIVSSLRFGICARPAAGNCWFLPIRTGSVYAIFLNGALGFIVNFVRSVPFLILLIAVIPFTRFLVGTSVGSTATIVPLVLASAPLSPEW